MANWSLAMEAHWDRRYVLDRRDVVDDHGGLDGLDRGYWLLPLQLLHHPGKARLPM